MSQSHQQHLWLLLSDHRKISPTLAISASPCTVADFHISPPPAGSINLTHERIQLLTPTFRLPASVE